MSLSEKAKTSLQIWQALENMDKTVDGLSKWVRLEDHRQEINAYAIRLDSLQFCLNKCTKSFERLERERGEQKQKIEHLWETLPLEYDVEIDEVTELGSKMQWREWLKKLKELLK